MSEEKQIILPQEISEEAIAAKYVDFRARVFRASEDFIEWSTVPIVHLNKEGIGVEHRSGVLLQIGSLKFVVTAGHNMIEHEKAGNYAAIVRQGKGNRPVPIMANKWHTTINEHEDLTVALMDELTVNALDDDYRYLRINDLWPSNKVRSGHFLIVGFPFHMIRPDDDGNKRCDTWKYLTYPYEHMESVENLDPAIHVVLRYDRESHNREGQTVHPPSMSGCGIWHITQRPELFTVDDLKLVAIQNSWHKGLEYAKGTWVDVVMIIIWRYYSDARSMMRLHGFEY